MPKHITRSTTRCPSLIGWIAHPEQSHPPALGFHAKVLLLGQGKKVYRRLNLRERVSLQGFPITFDIFGSSYSEQLKQIGNALPPVLSYYIAHAMLGTSPSKIKTIKRMPFTFKHPKERPQNLRIETNRSRYPVKRSFRAAIPGLRFGSGMRFELLNVFEEEKVHWEVRFLFGPSKDFQTVS